MTVEYRNGACFRTGWTWHPGVPYTKAKNHVPCFEVYWNDDGACERTGRHALMTFSDADNSQKAGTAERYPEDHTTLCSAEEYKDRKRALDGGSRNHDGVPARFLSESPL